MAYSNCTAILAHGCNSCGYLIHVYSKAEVAHYIRLYCVVSPVAVSHKVAEPPAALSLFTPDTLQYSQLSAAITQYNQLSAAITHR
jgi:hypothetical protein